MKSNFKDVQAFHDKFGIGELRPVAPQLLASDLAVFRLAFLLEELAEFAKGAGMLEAALKIDALMNDMIARPDRYLDESREKYADNVSAFDALLDLSVVTLGTADLMGLPWDAGWDVVHGRNMAKVRAASDGSNSKRKSKYDIVKPPGWYGPEPELRALLIAHSAKDQEDGGVR